MFKVRQIKRVITGKSFGHCPVPVRIKIYQCYDHNDDDDDINDANPSYLFPPQKGDTPPDTSR